MHKGALEKASLLALRVNTNSFDTYNLPAEYKSLSIMGSADIVSSEGNKGIFFSILEGVPDGQKGFLKVYYRNSKKNDDPMLFQGWDNVEALGDDWFLVTNY